MDTWKNTNPQRQNTNLWVLPFIRLTLPAIADINTIVILVSVEQTFLSVSFLSVKVESYHGKKQ
jgi:hypothetical protein